MTRTLARNCLGCGRSVRGKPRCIDCERDYQRAKRAKRPDLYADAAERRRRAMAVADWRVMMGDFCPGWARQPAHPSADLTADHVREVAAGGRPDGKLVVRCRSCNAARSAHLARKLLTSAFPPRAPPERPRARRTFRLIVMTALGRWPRDPSASDQAGPESPAELGPYRPAPLP